MGAINLEEAKVPYEGQNLPAVELIGILQTQLQEAASRMAGIASTLGDIRAALLNANMIEVKLTLSKEDYDRFKSLGGTDDSERIRKAVMSMIHPDASGIHPGLSGSRSASTPGGAEPAGLPVETQTEFMPAAEPFIPHDPERMPAEERIFPEPPAAPPSERQSTTRCPRCQSLIELPETSDSQWSVEIRCANCGVKYLVRSKPDDLA